jgi:hypothetical protein
MTVGWLAFKAGQANLFSSLGSLSNQSVQIV